jgi:hypothetical protein
VKKALVGSAQQLDYFTDSLAFHATDKMLKQSIVKLANKWKLFLEKLPKCCTLEQDVHINNTLLKETRKTSRITQYPIEDID